MVDKFDFDFLDDVMSLQLDKAEKYLQSASFEEIGPCVEFANYRYKYDKSWLKKAGPTTILQELGAALNNSDLTSFNSLSSRLRPIEFIRSPRNECEFDDNRWHAFLLRAQRAAIRSGIEANLARALVVTLVEMVENIFWHSDLPESGLTGYQWTGGRFDYVVADLGIGVLESLRKCSEYSELGDSREALTLALQNGITRFGSNSLRGSGFNRLILNFAKKSSDLRFRSGNASVSFDGVSAHRNGESPDPIIRSCPNFPGFLISVSHSL